MNKARCTSWKKFVTKVGNDEPYRIVYKLLAGKISNDGILESVRSNGGTAKTMRETARILLDTHVPDLDLSDETEEQANVRYDANIEPVDKEDCSPFSNGEVIAAVKALKNGKAPGLDMIETQVLKCLVKANPSPFTGLFNRCLEIGYFPKCWKDGNLRLIKKPKCKDASDPNSYRPICLLSVIGKLFA